MSLATAGRSVNVPGSRHVVHTCYRVLQSEKADVAQQMAAGLAAIVPTSIVVGLITGTEGTEAQVESGESNRKMDARIAEIKSTCGMQ